MRLLAFALKDGNKLLLWEEAYHIHTCEHISHKKREQKQLDYVQVIHGLLTKQSLAIQENFMDIFSAGPDADTAY
jgi:hypothetical protein